jgi:hypothetical protein
MFEEKTKYDPKIYGELGAEYLNKLDPFSNVIVDTYAQEQEKQRQQLIKEIEEGKCYCQSDKGRSNNHTSRNKRSRRHKRR